jgi:hypothetical protein
MICQGNVYTPLLLAGAAAGIILFPGFILSLPPVPQDAAHPTLAKRIFFTGEVNGWNVLVHGIILLIIWGLLLNLILRHAGICYDNQSVTQLGTTAVTSTVANRSLLRCNPLVAH